MEDELQSEFRRLLDMADSAKHGEERQAILQKAVDVADRMNDLESRMWTRLELIREATGYNDTIQMLVFFPPLIRLMDDYRDEPECAQFRERILWKYKWVIEEARDFYQITGEQMERLAEDMKRRYVEYGYSLRPYYQHLMIYYQGVDDEKAEECYREFLSASRDSLSDCRACECSTHIEYLLYADRVKEAYEKSRPVLSRRITCDEQPYRTELAIIEYVVISELNGKIRQQLLLEKMDQYVRDARYALDTRRLLLEYTGVLLCYYALFEPEKALPWIKKNPEFTEKFRDPRGIFYFCLGMLIFIRNLKGKKTYRMKISSQYRFYNENGIYNTGEMREFYYSRAKMIAGQFEKNQGRCCYSELLRLLDEES